MLASQPVLLGTPSHKPGQDMSIKCQVRSRHRSNVLDAVVIYASVGVATRAQAMA